MTAIRAIVTIGLSALFLSIAGPSMFENPPWPYTGVSLASGDMFGNAIVHVDSGSPAYRAGLRTGDELGCLSRVDSELLLPEFPKHMLYTGTPIDLCARHGTAAWHALSFVPRRMSPPGLFYGSPLLAALRLVAFVLFLFVGCALVIARPSLMTWLLFGYCLASMPNAASAGMLVGLPPALYAWENGVTATWIDLGAAILALFALVVPNDTPPRGWRRSAFAIVAVAAIANASWIVLFSLRPHITFINPLDEAFTILTVLIVIARLATMEQAERARFGWAAFAIVFGVIVNDVRNVTTNVTLSGGAGIATVVMPLCLMYAILRRHVIDVRFVISRGLVYALVTTLVVGLIGAVDWATSVYLHEARVAMALDAAVTIALGIALHRGYRSLDHAIDFLLFHEKHAAEEYLARLARTLPFATAEATVDAAIVSAPYEKFSLSAAALYREQSARFEPVAVQGCRPDDLPLLDADDDLVRFLKAERGRITIGDLHERLGSRRFGDATAPALAVPIFQSNELTGFALYGLHRDGTRLDPDEERALERICDAAAQAYTSIELARYRENAATAQVRTTLPAMEAP